MLPIPPFANIDLTDDQVGQLAKLKRALDSFNAGAFATLHLRTGIMKRDTIHLLTKNSPLEGSQPRFSQLDSSRR